MSWIDRRPQDMATQMVGWERLKIQDDPEALFLQGLLLAEAGDRVRSLDMIQRAVSKSYFVAPTLEHSPHFDILRDDPAFQALLVDAQAGRDRALAAFREAGGERLLGR